jgi:hypothetical protein
MAQPCVGLPDLKQLQATLLLAVVSQHPIHRRAADGAAHHGSRRRCSAWATQHRSPASLPQPSLTHGASRSRQQDCQKANAVAALAWDPNVTNALSLWAAHMLQCQQHACLQPTLQAGHQIHHRSTALIECCCRYFLAIAFSILLQRQDTKLLKTWHVPSTHDVQQPNLAVRAQITFASTRPDH